MVFLTSFRDETIRVHTASSRWCVCVPDQRIEKAQTHILALPARTKIVEVESLRSCTVWTLQVDRAVQSPSLQLSNAMHWLHSHLSRLHTRLRGPTTGRVVAGSSF